MNIEDIYYISAAIISSVGGSALIIFGLSTWLGKVWAGRILEQDKAKYQSAIEVLKSNLNAKIHEYNVAASRVDTQRSEAIQNLFVHLIEWFEVSLNIRAPNNQLKHNKTQAIEKYKQWADELNIASINLTKLAMRTSIFLKPETYNIVQTCGLSIASLTTEFCHTVLNSKENDVNKLFDVIEKAREKMSSDYSDAFEPAREALNIEFRSIIDPSSLKEIS